MHQRKVCMKFSKIRLTQAFTITSSILHCSPLRSWLYAHSYIFYFIFNWITVCLMLRFTCIGLSLQKAWELVEVRPLTSLPLVQWLIQNNLVNAGWMRFFRTSSDRGLLITLHTYEKYLELFKRKSSPLRVQISWRKITFSPTTQKFKTRKHLIKEVPRIQISCLINIRKFSGSCWQ